MIEREDVRWLGLSRRKTVVTQLVLTLVIICPQAVHSTRGGLRAGVNVASLGGGIESDHVTRPLLGFLIVVGVTERFSIQSELMMSYKGGQGNAPAEVGYPWPAEGSVGIDYLELPLLVRFAPERFRSISPFFYTGAAFAFRSAADVKGIRRYSGETSSTSITALTEHKDIGLVVGTGVGAGKGRLRLEADVRYTHGLSEIDALDPKAGIKNRSWTLSIGFLVRPERRN